MFKTYYNVIQYHAHLTIQISKGLYVYMISKNANSTLGILGLNYNDVNFNDDISQYLYSHLNTKNHIWGLINTCLKYDKDIDFSENKLVFVYRDPIDRLLSAHYTIAYDMPFEQYFNAIIDTFKTNNYEFINNHILPQSCFIDVSKIDLYVNINDLPEYIESLGLSDKYFKINQTKNEQKCNDIELINKYRPRLMEIYKEDYEIINNIPIEKMFKKN